MVDAVVYARGGLAVVNVLIATGLVYVFWYDYSRDRAVRILRERRAAGDRACIIAKHWHGWVVVNCERLSGE